MTLIPEKMMKSIMNQLIELMQAYAKKSLEEEKEGEGESEEDSDDCFGDSKQKKKHQDSEDDDSDPDDVYDDEYMLGDSDLGLYEGFFNQIEAPLYFKETMRSIQSSNPEMYNALVKLISKKDQTALEQVFADMEGSSA